MKGTSESQGICLNSQGICDRILKFIFSQVEDPYFENSLGLMIELNLGLEKSGKSQGMSYCLESGNPVLGLIA